MAEKKEETTKVSAEKKTTPSLRKLSDENTFAKDYLAHVDDSSNVPSEVHDRNKKDVEQSALQRGLRATGEVELTKSEVVDEHNVKLAYTVSVEPNNVK